MRYKMDALILSYQKDEISEKYFTEQMENIHTESEKTNIKCKYCQGTGIRQNLLLDLLEVVFSLGLSLFNTCPRYCFWCSGKGHT